MPERRQIRVSGAQDGRSERPAKWYGASPSRVGRVEPRRPACREETATPPITAPRIPHRPSILTVSARVGRRRASTACLGPGGERRANCGPSGYSATAGRMRSRPGSAVTIPPATSDSPWRASTSSHTAACRVTEQSTSLTMPQCGSPRTTASSPKSLSSVIRMRCSFRARVRIATSPGSVGKSPTQTTSWPESRSVVAALPDRHVSRSSFMTPRRRETAPTARGRRADERIPGRRGRHRARATDSAPE